MASLDLRAFQRLVDGQIDLGLIGRQLALLEAGGINASRLGTGQQILVVALIERRGIIPYCCWCCSKTLEQQQVKQATRCCPLATLSLALPLNSRAYRTHLTEHFECALTTARRSVSSGLWDKCLIERFLLRRDYYYLLGVWPRLAYHLIARHYLWTSLIDFLR